MHARTARAIKQARGKRSAQWLADRTAELGYPITRAQIANYESGRKQSLDIAELIVIAAALNTAPLLLLYPGPYDANVEVLPGRSASEFDATEWFSGEDPVDSLVGWELRIGDEDNPNYSDGDWRRWESNVAEIQEWRALDRLIGMRNDLLAEEDDRLNKRIGFLDEQIMLTRKEIKDRWVRRNA